MGHIADARRGVITPEVRRAAAAEGVRADFLRKNVARGRAVVMRKGGRVLAIGKGLRTKVNANIGMSPDFMEPKEELAKLKAAVEAGADTVMDLSIAGEVLGMLKRIVKESPIPVGSVPVYTAVVEGKRKGDGVVDLAEDDFFSAVESHLKAGVNFVTVHAAITRKGAELARKRTLQVVSRGGCFLTAWMMRNGRENPYYGEFDYLLEMLAQRDAVLSIGDALRPGCIADADDAAQNLELAIQGKLARRCLEKGVQVICEGPGHMRLNQIAANVRKQKRLCHGAPYYVLGPLVTDIAVGYDHICAAVGGTVAAAAGADFLCVVTPSEHVALPTAKDVEEGVIASRIAAHAGDLVKLGDGKRDLEMSKARGRLDWEKQFALALFPKKAAEYRNARGSSSAACSMCGEFCAYKIGKGALG